MLDTSDYDVSDGSKKADEPGTFLAKLAKAYYSDQYDPCWMFKLDTYGHGFVNYRVPMEPDSEGEVIPKQTNRNGERTGWWRKRLLDLLRSVGYPSAEYWQQPAQERGKLEVTPAVLEGLVGRELVVRLGYGDGAYSNMLQIQGLQAFDESKQEHYQFGVNNEAKRKQDLGDVSETTREAAKQAAEEWKSKPVQSDEIPF